MRVGIGILCLLLAAPSVAQEAASESAFVNVRTYTQPEVAGELLRAELVRKESGDMSAGDVVDLNLPFAEAHGKPRILPPQMAPQTASFPLFFPDGWSTVTMIRTDGKGPYACRVIVTRDQERPPADVFARYIFWCQSALTMATLDPSLFTPAEAVRTSTATEAVPVDFAPGT